MSIKIDKIIKGGTRYVIVADGKVVEDCGGYGFKSVAAAERFCLNQKAKGNRMYEEFIQDSHTPESFELF